MAIKLRYYLDARNTEPGAPAPLRLMVNKDSRTAFITLGLELKPSEWDAKEQKVIKHPHRSQLNDSLAQTRLSLQEWIVPKYAAGEFSELDAKGVKDAILEHLNKAKARTPLRSLYEAEMARKSGNTAALYGTVWKKVREYDAGVETMAVELITPKWCEGLSDWLGRNVSANYRNAVISCLRRVLNVAIDEGIISRNPTKGIRTGYVQTKKRDLSLDAIRRIWREPAVSEAESQALDLFKFSFLTRAANTADIDRLSRVNVYNGRIEYDRSKTGKHYSVKIEPELQALIDKYSDAKRLFPFRRKGEDMRAATHRINYYLRLIGTRCGCDNLTMYWARHTFATIAYDLGASIETVSAALGHSYGAQVTMGYVDVGTRKVDELARKVYDAVLKD